MSITRPTSRTTALAFIVPKVMIWATLSRPYLRVTYSITSPRRASQKSMSMSGGRMPRPARLGERLQEAPPVEEAVARHLLEVAKGAEAGRHVEGGQRRDALELEVAHLGDLERRRERP